MQRNRMILSHTTTTTLSTTFHLYLYCFIYFMVSIISTPALVALSSVIRLETSVNVRWIPSLLTVFSERR